MADAPCPVTLLHTAGRRTRLRAEGLAGNADALVALADRIASLPGVTSVEPRPLTGSLIVHHDGPAERLIEAATTAGLVRPTPPAPVIPVTLAAGLAGLAADQRLKDMSGGRLDLGGAMFVVLAGLAIVQAARGQLVGPALTLALQAASYTPRIQT